MSKYIPGNQKYLTLNNRIYIENENNSLDLVEKQIFHKQAMFLLCIVNIFVLAMLWQNLKAGSYLLNGIIMETVLLLLVKHKAWITGLRYDGNY